MTQREALIRRHREHPGRGGCGVGAVVDFRGPSAEVVAMALDGLACMEHRGGTIDDTGDGAGLLVTTDQRFFSRFIAPHRRLPEGQRLIVGVIFFPPGEEMNLPPWQHEIDATLRRHGLAPLGWRHVPVDDSALGARAHAARRDVWQVLVGDGMVQEEDLPLALFRVKAQIERSFRDIYIASLSARTMVYKALATGEQLRRYYPDLSAQTVPLRSDVAVFHRRYSTNTFSNWYLAQVFRVLCHNGEINTIKANRDAVRNLEAELGLPGLLMNQGSDSADLDRIVELLVSHGISLPEALMRMLPLAWADLDGVTPDVVRFYQGAARALGTLGAWEGPAALVATDGVHLVGMLDRMGLRPLRWVRTAHRLIIGSELGAVGVDASEVLETGQLDPGEGIAVELATGRLLRPRELIAEVVAKTPLNYAELAEGALIALPPRLRTDGSGTLGAKAIKPDQRVLNLFGWTPDRVRTVKFMAEGGKEPITSMGFDRPLAVLSPMRPPLAKYFKQIVAVVTNPPIDPLREGSAFDLTVCLGRNPRAEEQNPTYQPEPQYRLASPFLTADQLARIRDATDASRPRAEVLDCTFEPEASVAPEPARMAGSQSKNEGQGNGGRLIARRIAEIARDALKLVRSSRATILVLSDRRALLPVATGAAPCLPLPLLFAVAAVHNALTADGCRRHASLIVESGEVQEGHDAALLFGAGADAVHPHLFFDVGGADSAAKLLAALDSTLMRCMSKMGITTFDGYRGSRLFEGVGVAAELVEYYLPGVTSRLGGITLDDLHDDIAFRAGLGGAPHTNTEVSVYRKEVWQALQEASRGNEGAWDRFRSLIDATPPVYLRDLLRFRTPGGAAPDALDPPEGNGFDAAPSADCAIPVEEVASVERIVAACFRGAAMSHGALHRTAHRAIAAAFNALGAASNCGEGGEDPRRDRGGEWESDRSRIRQLGSARFGVDARFLAHADELQIKIGQGAKPGEGGMLPGAKVTVEIAAIRRTQVGVTLISPPPHHDIYSIEDLAQLLYNLKQVNPTARVSVKMPAVTDIGTIAVGVAKAGADTIDISGFEGGTGAAASSSIEHAGLPLERGLSESHQALLVSGIRDRVRLRADGGLKTGRDIAVALALGADEVSLGTALMIAEQCIFCHGCSKGNCPAGITTASDLVSRRLMTDKKGRAVDAELRDVEDERYRDAREAVTRYLIALGGELRGILAGLGLRHPAALVGRVDLLEQVPRRNARTDRMDGRMEGRMDRVDLSEVLVDARGAFVETASGGRRTAVRQALPIDPVSDMNRAIVEAARRGAPEIALAIGNGHRAVGATCAGHIASGRIKLAEGGLTVRLRGTAGQALGFALVEGMRIELEGFANDMVGEAMAGGEIVIRLPRELGAEARDGASAIGNAACYGATSGRLFVEGRAGQRLGVRNSAATIVTLGAGKYAFEYMTGGLGMVLGPIGPVVGSGMTGGVLWLLDETGGVERSLHAGSVELGTPEPGELDAVRALIAELAERTGSDKARSLAADFAATAKRLKKVVPRPTVA